MSKPVLHKASVIVPLFGGSALLLVLGLVWYLRSHMVAVLQPAGEVAAQERQLIVLAILLSVLVVLPVYILTILIAVKYRESNKKRAKYTPDWDHSRLYESIWWGVPGVIILVLSVVTWQSSHALDPFRPLAGSTAQPLTIQVVALDWKWLFIYPKQQVASVNFVQIPVNAPIEFQITSDTVMNSFWIPRLGGQIYAMPGMSTQLHLMASQAGSYRGSSANISGVGFATMNFTAKASSRRDFDGWVQSVQHMPTASSLDEEVYGLLAKPSSNVPPTYFSSVEPGLYDTIVMKYMGSMTHGSEAPAMSDMNMGTTP